MIDYFETVQSVIYFIWFLSLITALLVFPGDLIALWLHSQRSCWLGLLVAFYMFCYSFFFLKLNLNVLHSCICRASGKSSIKHIPSESVSVRILRLVGCPLPTWRVWIPALKPCEYGLWLEFAKGYLFHTNLSLPRTRVKSDVIFYCLFLLSLKSFICRRRHPLFPSAFPACSAWNFFFFLPKQSLKTLCFQAPLIIEFSSLPPVSFPRVSRVAAFLRGKVHKILLWFSFCLLTPTYRNPCHFAVQLGSSYAIINFFPWPYLSETHASLFPTEVRIH